MIKLSMNNCNWIEIESFASCYNRTPSIHDASSPAEPPAKDDRTRVGIVHLILHLRLRQSVDLAANSPLTVLNYSSSINASIEPIRRFRPLTWILFGEPEQLRSPRDASKFVQFRCVKWNRLRRSSQKNKIHFEKAAEFRRFDERFY